MKGKLSEGVAFAGKLQREGKLTAWNEKNQWQKKEEGKKM